MHPVIRFLIIPAAAGLAAGLLASLLHLNLLTLSVFVASTSVLATLVTSKVNPDFLHARKIRRIVINDRAFKTTSPMLKGDVLTKSIDRLTGRYLQFRRKAGANTWHVCSNCTSWPSDEYETTDTKPTTGEMCNECQALSQRGECRY